MVEDDERIEKTILALTAEDGEFPVVSENINGVDFPVFRNAAPNLRALFAVMIDHGEKDCFVFGEERISFAEGYARACRLARALTEEFDLKKGERVAIAMRNLPEWCLSFMAITMCGAVAVPLNGWWGAKELAFGLEDSGSRIAIVDEKRLDLILPFAGKLALDLISVRANRPHDARTRSYEALIAAYPEADAPTTEILPDDYATIIYTSGSTGFPKGVLSTHRSIINTVTTWAVAGLAGKVVDGTRDVEPVYPPAILLVLPLFHVTGSHSLFLLSLVIGRKIVFMYRWDATVALQLIEQERITSFTGVPTQSADLMNASDFDRYDVSSLLDLGAGGAARPAEHVRRLKKSMPNARPSIGYGLTETNALGCVLGRAGYLARPASVGRATKPTVAVRIVADDGSACATNEAGEIWIKTVSNLTGYWNNPEATAEILTDGWMKTGDLGYLDDGRYLFISGRKKEIIIRGGENISCNEVESALLSNEDVLEATVFSLPDERLGEIVGSVVHTRDASGLDEKSLQVFISDHVAAFKIPGKIWFTNEPLPRGATGKIDKKGIKAHYEALFDPQV